MERMDWDSVYEQQEVLKPVSGNLRDIAKALEAQASLREAEVKLLERIASYQNEIKDGITHLCQVGNAIVECLEAQQKPKTVADYWDEHATRQKEE